jgi:hypothetical protein
MASGNWYVCGLCSSSVVAAASATASFSEEGIAEELVPSFQLSPPGRLIANALNVRPFSFARPSLAGLWRLPIT